MKMSRHYEGLDGEIACPKHLGMYGIAHLEQDPNARMIKTPINVWVRMTASEMKDFADFMAAEGVAGAPICETCRFDWADRLNQKGNKS